MSLFWICAFKFLLFYKSNLENIKRRANLHQNGVKSSEIKKTNPGKLINPLQKGTLFSSYFPLVNIPGRKLNSTSFLYHGMCFLNHLLYILNNILIIIVAYATLKLWRKSFFFSHLRDSSPFYWRKEAFKIQIKIKITTVKFG